MCDHGYDGLVSGMQRHVNSISDTLFTTNVDGDALWGVYLDNLPAEHRQYYTCSTCKSFFRRYGNLATISADGKINSLMFRNDAPVFFTSVWNTLRRMVETARINGIFLSKTATIGTAFAGGFNHFAVKLHTRYVSNLAAETMITKRENYKTVMLALQKYTPDVVDTALSILESGTIYRADRVLGSAKFLKDLHAVRGSNLVWKLIATAPDAFCHISSSVIGTLLDDIADGLDFDSVKRRFEAKMNPANYQRATVAPSAGVVRQAEKLFEQMNLAPSLDRRFASMSDLPKEAFIWRAMTPNAPKGIFASVSVKNATPKRSTMAIEPTKITWDKFVRTVLPDVQKLEVMPSVARKAAIVTAQDDTANPILAWDNKEKRNQFSWYYSAGIDGEIKRRLDRAGGKYTGVKMRASLIWNNTDDLDIHIVSGKGRIWYNNKCADGGELDVDMNVSGETTEPVENVRWVNVLNGTYAVYVNCYRNRNRGYTPFTVEIDVSGAVHTLSGTIAHNDNSNNHLGWMVRVADIQHVNGVFTVNAHVVSRVNEPTAQAYEIVSAIVKSPNLWYNDLTHFGNHAFLITGTSAPDNPRGIITEMLRNEVKPVRSVIESYMSGKTIAGDAGVCGYGLNSDNTGNMRVRVTKENITQEYIIDRWD